MPDLVSAMVLAELLAGDVPRPRKPAVAETPGPADAAPSHSAPSDSAPSDSAADDPSAGGTAAGGTAAGGISGSRAPGKSAPGGSAAPGIATGGSAAAGSAPAGPAAASAATSPAGTENTGTAASGGTEPDAGASRDGTGSGPESDDGGAAGRSETTRLKATIAQLEHALATRVRIEQAIGVLAERHRLTPRQAFDILRKVARSGGNRVHDVAGEVVASTSNPLLLLPADLARPQLQQPARSRPRRPRPR